MKVINWKNEVVSVASEAELLRALEARNSDGAGDFYISGSIRDRGEILSPFLFLAMKGAAAYALYGPEGEESFASLGEDRASGFTNFLIEGDPEHPVPNYQVITKEDAVAIALAFFRDPMSLPSCIKWEEL